MSVSIVIPTRNEALNISNLLNSIYYIMTGNDYEVIVVDDSDDETAAVAKILDARVINGQRKGLGQAIIDGINAATKDIVVVMDADGSHSPKYLQSLIHPVDRLGYDMAIGSRYAKDGGDTGWAFHRKWISRFACVLAMPISGIRDNTSGFFAFRRNLIKGVKLEASSWKIMLEILVKSGAKRVIEVPIVFQDRLYGKSKFNRAEVVRYLAHLVKLAGFKILRRSRQDDVQTHTVGMFAVGALVWILYLAYANLLTIRFGVNHFVAELSGIPLSWVINYALNTKLNFDLAFTWKRFAAFCGISAGGWLFYELTTWICTDVLGWYSLIGTIIGVGTKTIMNVVLQQAITFGLMANRDKKQVEEHHIPANYDWDAYYHGNPIQKYWKHKIAEYTLDMVSGEKVLDVGCGSSPLLMLVNAPYRIGVDTNVEKLEFISGRDRNSKYIPCNGFIPVQDNFDTVICNEVIEHHPRPARLVEELSRLTKNGGVLVISTPDYSSVVWNIIEVLYGLAMRKGYYVEHNAKFTETGLVSLCNAYGFELEGVKRVAKCDMVCKFRKS